MPDLIIHVRPKPNSQTLLYTGLSDDVCQTIVHPQLFTTMHIPDPVDVTHITVIDIGQL